MRPDLRNKYKNEIIDKLQEKFQYKNQHEVPKIVKIQLNQCLGTNATNNKTLEKAIQEMRTISGLQPLVTKAKKIRGWFKIREDQPLGITVTLRKKYMYSFLERLIHLVLPRTRDFQGLSTSSFDKFGNYNFGLQNQLVFPEIPYESVNELRGLNITIVTTAKSKAEGLALLESFGVPFKNK